MMLISIEHKCIGIASWNKFRFFLYVYMCRYRLPYVEICTLLVWYELIEVLLGYFFLFTNVSSLAM